MSKRRLGIGAALIVVAVSAWLAIRPRAKEPWVRIGPYGGGVVTGWLVHPDRPGRVVLGLRRAGRGSEGRIYYSNDAGQTWTEARFDEGRNEQAPWKETYGFALDPADHDHLLAASGGSGAWESNRSMYRSDEVSGWVLADAPRPRYALAWDRENPQHRVVSMDMQGLGRSWDGGKTFTPLSTPGTGWDEKSRYFLLRHGALWYGSRRGVVRPR